MSRTTKALSGASQDAYFRRILKAHPTLSADERDRLVQRLREEVAQLRVRTARRRDIGEPAPVPAATLDTASAAAPLPPAAAMPPPPFDPFSPNIIVVVRRSGRDAALAALDAIDNPDNLRLLAREQRLNVGADVGSVAELRVAIVTAAERRIANRVAAAS